METGEDHLVALAHQIEFNLRHQHQWTSLTVHTRSSGKSHENSTTVQPLPRPLVSGLPPQRLYVHPDEQIEAVMSSVPADETASTDRAVALEQSFAPQREWVLPTRAHERWTIERFAAVFDSIDIIPPSPLINADSPSTKSKGQQEESGVRLKHGEDAAGLKWRKAKRVLLATADDDSTIVYYIVHDGLVKPRQN